MIQILNHKSKKRVTSQQDIVTNFFIVRPELHLKKSSPFCLRLRENERKLTSKWRKNLKRFNFASVYLTVLSDGGKT